MTDEELAVLAQGGDKQAEEDLLQQFKEMVRAKAHLYFMLGAETEDVVQEGMIGLFKAIRDYDASKGSSFRTFADLCVNRQIITAIKAAGRRKYEPLNSALSIDKPVNDDDPVTTLGETLRSGSDTDPLAIVLLGELTELIMSPESRLLSDFEHQVLSLMTEGYDYRKIAEMLGKSPKSTDNAIQRIRTKIKRFFAEGEV